MDPAAWRSISTTLPRVIFVCNLDSLILSSALHAVGKSKRSHHHFVPAGTTSSKCINACLAPIASLDGCSIMTVEGLGSCSSGFNPVQGMAAVSQRCHPTSKTLLAYPCP